jgi:protein kinase-like protein
MADDVIDLAIAGVADGQFVDWNLLESGALSDFDRERIKCLRILEDIGHLHRTIGSPLPELSDIETQGATNSPRVVPQTLPRSWGRYELREIVGSGSFGSVYRAWDPELEREVAIKILHPHVADQTLKQRLLQEGRALAKVRHPNVVNVLGVEAHEERVGLCMEFVYGETLDTVLHTHGVLNAREAVGIAEDLCQALTAVHRAGFIHRDIKAKNVMREREGRIVLMDFGTGRSVDRPEMPGDIAGTPLYMAPEVLAGEPASPCSDVYSLGVLIYHLVTGAYPVEAASLDEIRDAHANRRRSLLGERRPDLPVSFIRVVSAALAPDPLERCPTAGALLEALGTIRAGADAKIDRKSRVAMMAAVPVVAVCVLTALGALTSAAFDIGLERSGFVNETLRDWLFWGWKTTFPTLVILIMTLVVCAPALIVGRLLFATSTTAQRVVRSYIDTWTRRLRLDDVSVLASYSMLLSLAALGAAIWWFFPLLSVLVVTRVSTGPGNDLALLSPTFVGYHNQYRWIFSFVVMVSVAVWWPVLKLIRKGQTLHWGMMVGGAVVTAAAMILLHFPYRLLYFSKGFEAVSWNNASCYVIGERDTDLLLFCPGIELPRSRIVKKGDKAVLPRGVTGNIFAPFGRSATDQGTNLTR